MTKIYAKEHYYNANGDRIPSVTTALNELSKPALVRWANKLGLQGIDSSKYKDELADIGTLTHYFIICWLRQEEPDVSDYTPKQVEMAQACFRKYIDWEKINPVKTIFAEVPLVSERYQYGGTPDLYAVCNNDLLLVDFKTNAVGIFPEMIYQVAAYYNLILENGYRLSKATVLRLPRNVDEGADEHILTDHEIHTGFEIFLRCLDIYRLKRGQEFLCTERRFK